MGILDVFTGNSAKKAAAQNTARLADFKTEGTGILDNSRGMSLASLDSAAGAYDPLKAISTKYGRGTDLYLDSLGINGPEGNARAVGSFQEGPGYRFAVDQATDAIARKANALGVSAGGNTLAALSDRAGQMANLEYGGWQDRLAGLINPELTAATSAAGGEAGINTAKAGVWTDDAARRLGLSSGVVNGINSQTTQAANAETAGSGNLWGLGLNLAKLAAGAATGGTSLLGGGGINLGGPGGPVPFPRG